MVSGLLSSIGATLGAHTVQTIGHDIAIALPLEGLYQTALHAIGSHQPGLVRVLLNLGPFGSAQAGSTAFDLWALAYLVIAATTAWIAFERQDL